MQRDTRRYGDFGFNLKELAFLTVATGPVAGLVATLPMCWRVARGWMASESQ